MKVDARYSQLRQRRVGFCCFVLGVLGGFGLFLCWGFGGKIFFRGGKRKRFRGWWGGEGFLEGEGELGGVGGGVGAVGVALERGGEPVGGGGVVGGVFFDADGTGRKLGVNLDNAPERA